MTQKADYTVRDAAECDIPFVCALEKANFNPPWSENQLTQQLYKPGSVFLVAVSGASVCGYLTADNVACEMFTCNLAVDENCRRTGVGSLLLERYIEYAVKSGCFSVTLEVRESNAPARALYEKFGFINLGIRKNFYSHPDENACIYTKELK